MRAHIALLFAAVGSLEASTCPAGQTEVCVVSCFCAPGGKDEVGALFDNVSLLAAAGLKTWLQHSAEYPCATRTLAEPPKPVR